MKRSAEMLAHARERADARGPHCSICNLPAPLLSDIHVAYRDGLGQVRGLLVGIHDYVVRKGGVPGLSYSALKNHFQRGHHDDAR